MQNLMTFATMIWFLFEKGHNMKERLLGNKRNIVILF